MKKRNITSKCKAKRFEKKRFCSDNRKLKISKSEFYLLIDIIEKGRNVLLNKGNDCIKNLTTILMDSDIKADTIRDEGYFLLSPLLRELRDRGLFKEMCDSYFSGEYGESNDWENEYLDDVTKEGKDFIYDLNYLILNSGEENKIDRYNNYGYIRSNSLYRCIFENSMIYLEVIEEDE